VVIVIDGGGRIGEGENRVPFQKGETILIPASVAGTIDATTNLRWLEATVKH
jgi:mannose-6-phosphate isomerase class I